MCLYIVTSKNVSIRLENILLRDLALFQIFSPCHRARLSHFANLHRIAKICDTYVASITVVFFYPFFFARHTDYSGL